MKSYIVNFHTQMSRSQIRIANDVFSRVRKMVRSIKSHIGVRVSRQNTAFRRKGRHSLQLATPLLCEVLCRHLIRKDHKAEFLLKFFS